MSMMTILRVKTLDRQALARLADWLAVAVAVSLPWSTSATSILIALWLLAALPTFDIGAVRRELATAAGGLPILLCLLATAGMLWADVSWRERLDGLEGFHRLLVIPLLLTQFRRSENGIWVLYGFFVSVVVELAASWALALTPGLAWRGNQFGVPAKDYILQSMNFLVCAFALLGRAFDETRLRRWRSVAGLVALAVVFLANIFFVATGRTTLLVLPVFVLLLGWREFGWKGLLGAGILGCGVGVMIWFASPYLHQRLIVSLQEYRAYRATDASSSTGAHLEFLKKSLSFVESAPLIGHGTGSITEEFRNAAIGQTGAAALASVNPHNQIFAVAIQLGVVGAAVLVAMWVAHFMLFRGAGLTAWIGTIVVVQNVVSSLFNTHLFDFTQGWFYVFGVGVVGGMTLRVRDRATASYGARP
jgi:O-antigen ligase